MSEPTMRTVARRLDSLDREQCRLRKGGAMILPDIAALARAGLIFTFSMLCWAGNGLGVKVVLAQTEPTAEESNTGVSAIPPLDVQDIHSQLNELLQEKTPASPVEEKIDSNVRRIIRQLRRGSTEAPFSEKMPFKDFSNDLVRINEQGEVQVYVILKNFTPDGVAQLAGLGLRVELTLSEHRLIQGWVRYDVLETVAALDIVQRISPPDYLRHNSGAIDSEGDAILRADVARGTFGVDGSGVKTCVLSGGVDHLANSVASGDLPSSPPVQVLKNPGGDDEGTAILEIIHDLAPGAPLAFYGARTSAEFLQGLSALEGAGCRVIVDDTIAPGEPKFEDGPLAQRVRQLATGGVVYVSAAGNYAQVHYIANYRRLTGQGFPSSFWPAVHNFSAASVDIGDTFVIPAGGVITIALQWNNKFGASGDDFDLFLARSDNFSILKSSINIQNGHGDPLEFLTYTNSTGTSIMAFVAIAEFHLVSDPSTTKLNYFVFPGNFLPVRQYVVPGDSIFGHPTVNGILSVAAINASSPTLIEPFIHSVINNAA